MFCAGSYRELLDDGGGSKNRRRFEGQHGILALQVFSPSIPERSRFQFAYVEAPQAISVRVELVVVELDELLCSEDAISHSRI